ncbi:MAG TPA: polysaccharide deacetylase family protein [Rhodanobacteraceae bacterium]
MTTCYITIDTEYDFGFTRRMGAHSRAENFQRSIICAVGSAEAGIRYQMDVLDRHGLKAVFFIDPMPALVWGTAAIEDILRPILQRGHDVQLHAHTEWLELAGSANPLGKRTGMNIKDFSFEQQCLLLDYAKRVLVAAGAPVPVAFRAGNYGANDDTLRALAAVGLRYDTSHCPGIDASACAIGLTSSDRAVTERCGILEVPIGCIAAWRGGLRHAQMTALSAAEMLAALRHCVARGIDCFTFVSHSFELLSRDRTRINKLVRRRFEVICANMGAIPGLATGTYAATPPRLPSRRTEPDSVTPFNPLRLGGRMASQALGNFLYGRR